MSGREEARRDAESNYRQEVRGEVLSEVNSVIERKIDHLRELKYKYLQDTERDDRFIRVQHLDAKIDVLIELRNELE